MSKPFRLLAALALTVSACGEGASFVQPQETCARANEYTVYLDEGTSDLPAAIGSLAARHPFVVLRTFDYSEPSFVGRMTPLTAMRLAGQGIVTRVEHSSCYNGPIEIRSDAGALP